jgi:hypothetical protein
MLKPQYLYNIDRFGHDELAKEGASSGALLSGSSYDFFTRLRMLSMATSPQSPNNFASMEA